MKRACSKASIFGFTLVELLVVVSILGILFSLGLAQYMRFNRQQILNQAVLGLKNNMAYARETALSGKKNCEGVFDGILVNFGTDSYTLSSSCDDGLDSESIGNISPLPSGVRITAKPTDGILFKPITGGTNIKQEDGEVITLSGYGATKSLRIYPDGRIELIPEAE